MSNTVYAITVIALLAITTYLLRAVPFLIFSSKDIPDIIKYLGKVLSPAIMTILVCFCLKGLNFNSFSAGIGQLLAVLVAATSYYFKRNMYISVIISTIFYMIVVKL